MTNSEQPRSPGEAVKKLLAEKEWSQVELASVLGMPGSRVSELVQNKKGIDPELAVALSEVFIGMTPHEWLAIDAAYRLSLLSPGTDAVRKRAQLLECAPVKEMERRGWIAPTSSPEELERELKTFFCVPSFDVPPSLLTANRKTDATEELTPAQNAWCFRVRNIAKTLLVGQFQRSRLTACERELRKLAAFPQEARSVGDTLAGYGIRFVVIEPIATCKIDGVAMWLDEESPVIGMSLRFDRMDSFWFTLMHEFAHIKHGDALSIDANLVGAEAFASDLSAIEKKANAEASNILIPADALASFISRVSPLYSRDRINQFASKVKIHPSIVVGQLQHRAEIGFHAMKEITMTKIRDTVVTTAVTDGWGQVIG